MIASPTASTRSASIEKSAELEVQQLVVLAAGDRLAALPIQSFREVVPLPPITELPGTPPTVCGLINIRGRIHTLISLAECLGMPDHPAGDEAQVAVLERSGRFLGLLVDGVRGVVSRAEAGIDLLPPSGREQGAAVGIGCCAAGKFLLLDADGLVDPLFQ